MNPKPLAAATTMMMLVGATLLYACNVKSGSAGDVKDDAATGDAALDARTEDSNVLASDASDAGDASDASDAGDAAICPSTDASCGSCVPPDRAEATSCLSGVCRSRVPLVDDTAGALGAPRDTVAVGGGRAYFAVGSVLMSVASTGGPPTTLADLSPLAAGKIATDGTDIVFSHWPDPGVRHCDTADCATQTVLASAGAAFAVAVHAGSAYWLTAGGLLQKCPVDGCADNPQTLANAGTTLDFLGSAIAVDASGVYVAFSSGTVARYALDGSTSTVYASNQQTHGGIAVDATRVYWGTAGPVGGAGKLYACAKSGCAGAPTVISDERVYGLMVDATRVYWRESKVFTCPKSGCVACGRQVFDEDLTTGASFAQDDKNLYYANGTGRLIVVNK